MDNIKELVEQVKSGDTDALKAYVAIKRQADTCAWALKEILDDALSVRETYPEKILQLDGAIIESRSSATQYKFDHIPEYVAYKAAAKNLEENAKNALKLAQKGQELVIDGEVITPAKATEGKTTLFIKLLKDEK